MLNKYASNYINKLAATAPVPTKEQWAAMTPWQRKKYSLGTWGAINDSIASGFDSFSTGILRGAETIGLPAFSRGVVKGLVNLPAWITQAVGDVANGFGFANNGVGNAITNAGKAIELENSGWFGQSGDKSYIKNQQVVDNINNVANFAGELVGSGVVTAGAGAAINGSSKTAQVLSNVNKGGKVVTSMVGPNAAKFSQGIETYGNGVQIKNKYDTLAGRIATAGGSDPNTYLKNWNQLTA